MEFCIIIVPHMKSATKVELCILYLLEKLGQQNIQWAIANQHQNVYEKFADETKNDVVESFLIDSETIEWLEYRILMKKVIRKRMQYVNKIPFISCRCS